MYKTKSRIGLVWLAGCLLLSAAYLQGAFSTPRSGTVQAGTTSPSSLAKTEFVSQTITRQVKRSIEDIRPGDMVRAFDHETGKVVTRRVTQVHQHFTLEWLDVRLGNEWVTSTPSHRYWVESAQEWIEAHELAPGMMVRKLDGSFVAVAELRFRPLDQPDATFNFEVEGEHNYFVGEDGVLVHNGSPDLGDPGYWNYFLTDANDNVYYHGYAGPDVSEADVKSRHRNTADRFDDSPGKDKFNRVAGNRSYGEARVMEHTGIQNNNTNIGRDPNTWRGNRQNGISSRKIGKYQNAGLIPCT